MARDFAQLHLKIWNDDDFRALSVEAQHLYFVLISLPGLERTGVNDWRPKRIVPFARGWSLDKVNQAAAELIRGRFILVDVDTEEYLIRSFIRNDGFMKQQNFATNMARSFAMVASNGIRGVIVHELIRLKDEQPELAGWKSAEALSLTNRAPIDSLSFPCGFPFDPRVDPPVDPTVHPRVDPAIDPRVEGEPLPRVDPPVDPRITTGTGTGTLEHEQERGEPASSPPDSGDGFPPSLNSSDGPAAPPAGATPDQWSTHADPRCKKHAHIPPGEDVPKCRQCANVREWFEEQSRAEVEAHRTQVQSCQWCDDRGLINTHDTAGRPVALQCEHQGPPPEVEADTGHRELTSAEKRRQLIDQAFNRPSTGPF